MYIDEDSTENESHMNHSIRKHDSNLSAVILLASKVHEAACTVTIRYCKCSAHRRKNCYVIYHRVSWDNMHDNKFLDKRRVLKVSIEYWQMITLLTCGFLFFCRETWCEINFVRWAVDLEGNASAHNSPFLVVTVISGILRMKASTDGNPKFLYGNDSPVIIR